MRSSTHGGNRKEDAAVDALVAQLERGDIVEREGACRMLAGSIDAGDEGEGPIDGTRLVERHGARVAPLLLACLRVGLGDAPAAAPAAEAMDDSAPAPAPQEARARLLISACEALRALCRAGGVLICEQLTTKCGAVPALLAVVRECCAQPPPPRGSKKTDSDGKTEVSDDATSSKCSDGEGKGKGEGNGEDKKIGDDDDDDDDGNKEGDDEGDDDDMTCLLVQVVLLLTELAENSETALAQLTGTGFLASLAGLLLRSAAPGLAATPLARFWARAPRTVRVLAARLLHAATESNAVLARPLLALGGGDCAGLARACRAAAEAATAPPVADHELAALLFAVCANVCQACGACADGVYVREFAGLLTALLARDGARALLADVEPALVASRYEDEMEDDELAAASPPACLAAWRRDAVAQQVLLETIANACCSPDGPSPGDDDDDDDSGDGDDGKEGGEETMGDGDGSGDKAANGEDTTTGGSGNNGGATTEESFTPEVAVLRECGVLDAVAVRAGSGLAAAMEFAARHAWAARHAAELVLVQARALSCLSNVLINGLVGDPAALWRSGVAVTEAALTALTTLREGSPGASHSKKQQNHQQQQQHQNNNSSNHQQQPMQILEAAVVELLEEATSLLHAVAERVGATRAAADAAYRDATEGLVRVVEAGASTAAAVHAVRAVAVVARPLWATLPVAERVVLALLSVAMDEASDAELVSAACNAAMDLFAEDVTPADAPDAAARTRLWALHAQLTGALAQLLPALRRRIAALRAARNPELLAELRETRLNLSRFLRYKAQQKH